MDVVYPIKLIRSFLSSLCTREHLEGGCVGKAKH